MDGNGACSITTENLSQRVTPQGARRRRHACRQGLSPFALFTQSPNGIMMEERERCNVHHASRLRIEEEKERKSTACAAQAYMEEGCCRQNAALCPMKRRHVRLLLQMVM